MPLLDWIQETRNGMAKSYEKLEKEDEVIRVRLNGVKDQIAALRESGVAIHDVTGVLAYLLVDAEKTEVVAIMKFDVGVRGERLNPSCVNLACHHGSPVRGMTKWVATETEYDRKLYDGTGNEKSSGTDLVVVRVALGNLRAFLHQWGLPEPDIEQAKSLAGEAALKNPYARAAVEILSNPSMEWAHLDRSPFSDFKEHYLRIVVSGACDPVLRERLLDAPNELRRTVLSAAVRTGQEGWVNDLLDRGLPIDYERTVGPTALYEAVHDVAMCRLLLSRGARVDGPEGATFTPMFRAVENPEVVQLLVEHGANRRHVVPTVGAPLHEALKRPLGSDDHRERLEKRIEVAKFLMAEGEDPFWVPEDASEFYLTAFQRAVEEGDVAQVSLVIERFNVDYGQRTREGKSLNQLCRGNKQMQALLRAGKTGQTVRDAVADSASADVEPAAKSRGFSPL